MSDAPPLPLAAKLFAGFCLVLAMLALISFWPPRSPAVIAWLVVWVGVCLWACLAILRSASHAPVVVWILNILAGLSALAAWRGGVLRGVGILIDIVLVVPMLWFSVWYQRSRTRSGTSRSD